MTDTHIPSMNPILAELLRTESVATEEGRELQLHSHLPEREGRLLQHWLGQYRPSRLLEIGLAYGVSSLFICDVVCHWSVEHYHIIDAFQSRDWQGLGKKNLVEAGFGDLVELHEQLSELCLPKLLSLDCRYDFVFVDGWHTFDHVLLEFFYINRMLDVGGLVVFDDVHLPALQKVLAYVDSYDCYERLSFPDAYINSVPVKVRRMMKLPPARIAAFVKIADDTRDWDWFSDF